MEQLAGQGTLVAAWLCRIAPSSWRRRIEGPPISSQERPIPIKKQTMVKMAIVSMWLASRIMNTSPTTATISAVQPAFSPGRRAKSETVSALMNAVRAADARTRCAWAAVSATIRSAATETATKSSPISAPATLAVAVKKPCRSGGVMPA
jgi:hypothetical protein